MPPCLFPSTESSMMLTDLYELTMANGYWKLGRASDQAVFHLFFRKAPFAGGYALAAGLGTAAELLAKFHLHQSDLAYLDSLAGHDGRPLFAPGFLQYLAELRFSCTIDAVAEGRVVFAHQPLLRVQGDLLQCQLVESLLLNVLNFQTLIATKASRVCAAAGDDAVLEFGLRRAQGVDGGLSASRAAYIGGCAATSNVLAGKLWGIPVRGTHAHSWVMSFDSESEAFQQYAAAMPNNCVFLVDTYDTLQGVREAITVGRWLRERGHEMLGIRLDSGDLAYLSIESRRLLDEAGFPQALVVASSDLDEYLIESLKHQGARVAVWGVGTKLATAFDQPALGGVYKLGAIQRSGGVWEARIKVSDQSIKSTIPGCLQVRRFSNQERHVADAIYDQHRGLDPRRRIVDLHDPHRQKPLADDLHEEDLLTPFMVNGELVQPTEPLEAARRRARQDLSRLHPSIRRFANPHAYPAGLDIGLHEVRTQMIQAARERRERA